jgi:glycosyltransferase involved in cell wall biosynthesis
MKICFSPYKNNFNKYTEILIESLINQNIEVISFREMFANLKAFYSVDIVHLNWYESLYGKSKFNKIMLFFAKIFVLLLLRICNKKFVWTMHNKMSHEKELSFIQNTLMRIIIKYSSKIIIHSKQSEDILIDNFKIKNKNKICYVPHPNYINVYGGAISSYHRDNKLHLLFLGAVKPYKNIELLIDVVKLFPQTIELTIAGKVETLEYEKKLKEKIKNSSNIILNLDFVKDDEIATYIGNSDLTIFPYDMLSCLNSGSVFLSFSYGRSVICPEIGTILDLSNQDCILSYNYQTQEEHFIQLSAKLKEAIKLWNINPMIFEEWGTAMKEYVKKNNSKSMLIDSLLSIYKSINYQL